MANALQEATADVEEEPQGDDRKKSLVRQQEETSPRIVATRLQDEKQPSRRIPRDSPLSTGSNSNRKIKTKRNQPTSSSTATQSQNQNQSQSQSQSQSQRQRQRQSLSQWRYTIHAWQLRGLHVPSLTRASEKVFAGSFPAVAHFHIMAALGKATRHSLGSTTDHNIKHTPSAAGSIITEATWKRKHGEIAWEVSSAKMKSLKAFKPRVKVFVYGVQSPKTKHGKQMDAQHEDDEEEEEEDEEVEESIVRFGWFFLDLRTPDLPKKWLRLQNSPYGGEICISTSLAAITPSSNADTSLLSVADTHKSNTSATFSENYLKVGSRGGDALFVISILIDRVLGSHELAKFQGSGEDPQGEEDGSITVAAGFWLSYSLFDVVVQTDVFDDLSTCVFPSIRDNFRVMTSVEDLTEMFQEMKSQSVYLCKTHHVLSKADVEFDDLIERIKLQRDDSFDKVSISGEYKFLECDEARLVVSVSVEREERKSRQKAAKQESSGTNAATLHDETSKKELLHTLETAQISEDAQCLAVALQINQLNFQRSSMSRVVEDSETLTVELEAAGVKASGILCTDAILVDTIVASVEDGLELKLRLNGLTEALANGNHSIRLKCCTSDGQEVICANEFPLDRILRRPKSTSRLALTHAKSHQDIGEAQFAVYPIDVSDVTLPEREEKPAKSCGDQLHYQLKLEFPWIKGFDVGGSISFRYRNPFRSNETIVLKGPVKCQSKGEIPIADSTCVLDFRVQDESVLRRLMDDNLVIDILEATDQPMANEAMALATVTFSLNYLYCSQQQTLCRIQLDDRHCGRVFHDDNAWRQHVEQEHPAVLLESNEPNAPALCQSSKRCSISLPISKRTSVDSTSQQRLGSLGIVASITQLGGGKSLDGTQTEALKDTGQLQPTALESSSLSERPTRTIHQQAIPIPETLHEEDEPNPATTSAHQRRLEVQRLQEEWETIMQRKTKARMDELEQAWARREEERTSLLMKTLREYQQLEQKLHATLAELSKRERKLEEAERAFERKRQANQEEWTALQKRLEKDHSHAVVLAEQKNVALQQKCLLLEDQVRVLGERRNQLEKEFYEYRLEQRKLPESKLREQNAELKGTIAELEKQNAALLQTQSKLQQRVANADQQLEQMARLLQSEKLKHQQEKQEELEKLRLKYVARDERFVLDGDRQELREIKKQLEALRDLKDLSAISSRPGRRDNRRNRPQGRLDDSSADALSPSAPDSVGRSRQGRRSGLYDTRPSPSRSFEGPMNDEVPELVSATPPHSPEANVNHIQIELKRLKRERELLLASGAYTDQSYLVSEIDRLIYLNQSKLYQHQEHNIHED